MPNHARYLLTAPAHVRAVLATVMSAIALACVFPAAVLAQGPPIQTDTPIMLGLSGRGARTFLKVIRKGTMLRDGNEVADPLDRSMTAYVTPLAAPYNITTTFQVGAVVPFVVKTMDMGTTSVTSSGLGDAALFAKKLLVQVDGKARTFRVAAKATAKLPTGDHGAAIPLGTGSFDYGGSIVAGWLSGRWGVYLETLYLHRTTSGAVDYGDRYGYNAAIGFRLLPSVYEFYPSPQLNLFFELNGSAVGRAMVAGVENPDTGGSALFIAPGLQYVGGRRWLVEVSVQLPVRDDPNGTQLATDWTASLGARILLN